MPTTKTKAKPKTKAKKKATTKHPAKAKSATKSTHKAKTSTKVKAVKAKSKPAPKGKVKHHAFSDHEKETLLVWVQQIVDLRKHDQFGLRSLAAIEHILDHYNQHFTDAHEKFAAIVELGVQRRGRIDSGLIAFPDQGKDAVTLYAVLAEIGEEKTNYQEAHKKMNAIYDESLEAHQRKIK